MKNKNIEKIYTQHLDKNKGKEVWKKIEHTNILTRFVLYTIANNCEKIK